MRPNLLIIKGSRPALDLIAIPPKSAPTLEAADYLASKIIRALRHELQREIETWEFVLELELNGFQFPDFTTCKETTA